MSSEIRFYGLLYVSQRQEQPVNLKAGQDPLDVYLRCAMLCATSFAHHGHDWQLVTNDASLVRDRLAVLGAADLAVREHDFRWSVPADASFYAAHYKLELFEAFGTGDFGDRVGLVDIDTVLVRPFPAAVLDHAGLVGYDITSTEVPDYGEKAIADTVSLLAGERRPAAWWGGEFMLGRSADFAALMPYLLPVWDRYRERYREAHHVGDEAVTTAALSLLGRDGSPPLDAGVPDGVARWWSARTNRPHPPLSRAMRASLLHLPADKPFLSQESARPFDPSRFCDRYRRHAWRKLTLRRLLTAADRLRGRPAKAAPRL